MWVIHIMEIPEHNKCTSIECILPGTRKCKVVAATNMEPSFTLNEYSLYEVENVRAIGVTIREYHGWDVEVDTLCSGPIEQTYLYIDAYCDEAFAHWIMESSIHLVLWRELKIKYPGLKILSFNKKNYKASMYKAFDIDYSEISHTISIERNRVIFVKFASLADHSKPFLYEKLVKNFHTRLLEKSEVNKKDIDVLYLPRGSRENFMANDRTIQIQPILLDYIKHIPNSLIYYTDETTNMIDQINIVRRAKIIILNEGSSVIVNGYFSENADIIVLGGNGNNAHIWNPSPALLYYDSINRGNRYHHIPYEINIISIIYLLEHIKEGNAKPITPSRVICWKADCKYCPTQIYSQRALC